MTTAILGAGMAGLSTATRLVAAGHDVVLFEKSRGIGGRTTTRRRGEYRFDHGAQYFTVRDEAFGEQVEAWLKDRIVTPWEGRIGVWHPSGSEPTSAGPRRFVGVPGMNAMCHAMAEGLDVRLNTRIAEAAHTTEGWQLTDTNGQVYGGFESLVSSLPPAQAFDLLGNVSSLGPVMSSAVMAPCWAGMFVLEQPLPCDWDGVFVNEPGPIRWMARNGTKPGRPEHEVLIVHTERTWSEQHLEKDAEEVAAVLWQAVLELVPMPACEPSLQMAHRWRYSVAEGAPEVPCLVDEPARLVVCGDWCIGARVEGAWLSGHAAGKAVLEMCGQG